MRLSLGSLRTRIFGISAGETSFARRGFRGGDPQFASNSSRSAGSSCTVTMRLWRRTGPIGWLLV